ncbi:hypothetical protein KKF61_04515 [Patescibacteria group bacterium]|nr:hypothetical protein [Patescibacteria group bacterium]
MKYVIGTIVIIIGFLITWKSEWIVNNLGRIAWADNHLGTEGGSRLFYKLIGLAMIILSFMYMGGILQSILGAIFKPTIRTLE